jgi:CRISPR-associated protein Cas1
LSKRIISINTPGTYLREKDNHLEIWIHHERLGRIPIEDLGVVMIENNACTITATLLASLAEGGVVVSICDGYHLPGSLLLPLIGVSIHAIRTRRLAELTKPKKKKVWQQIISCKINFQSQVIHHLPREHGVLKRLSKEVDSGDSQNKEATAARIYWQVVFKEFLEKFKRSGENRINTYLNYGYAVVRASVSRALVGAGLTPIFGVFHKSRDNPFALADDFLEVFRPFVDLHIRKLLSTQKVEISDQAFKKEILKILTTTIRMNGEAKPFLTAIDTTVDSLVRFLENPKHKLIFPDLCAFQATD